MAESILNFCKSLEILFVTSRNSRDDIRRELNKLGYNEDEIEGDFIPLVLLRRCVDVAHPRVALFKRRDLQVLYRYVIQSEECIRELLNRVIAKIREGSYALQQDEDLSLDRKERKDMDMLVAKMNSRIKPPVKGIGGS